MNAEERRRIVSKTREIAGEAATAHTLSDDECERGLLERGLDAEQAALDQLQHQDPLGVTIFGDRDAWVDSRLSRTPPK